MHIIFAVLINGFLLSITPSTVTDNPAPAQSPVVQPKCTMPPATPFMEQPLLPLQPQLELDFEKKEKEEKKEAPQTNFCPIAMEC